MPIDFPNNPSLNQTFTDGTTTWRYNGVAWDILPSTSPVFTNVTTTNLTVSGNLNGVTLNDLDDVSLSSPSNGAVLSYSSSSNTWSSTVLASSFTGGTVPNPINVTSTAASTSKTTGAITIAGGLGVSGSAFIGGSLSVENNNINLKSRSELRFSDTDSSNYIGFKAPTNVTANKVWILPAADGTAGQFLRTDGSGTLSWATVSSSGPGGTANPGGSDTYVQFNDSDTFGGDASFTFDVLSHTVTVQNLTANTRITIEGTDESTDAGTGSVVSYGGLGIAGQLNVAGSVNKFTSATASTSSETGAVIVNGGLGVGGDVYVGGTVDVVVPPTSGTHVANKSYVDSNVLAFSIAFGA